MKRRSIGHLMASTALTLCLSHGMMSTPAGAVTLEEAMIAAYITNPSLGSERASVRASDEGVAQALSNWRPTVEFTADVGRERNDSSLRTGTAKVQNRTPSSYSIDLSQSIFRGGRTMAETSEAENTVKADRARLISAEQDILLAAVSAYLDVYRDQAVLELNINNEAVLRRQLEATQDRFEVGEITRTDVHQAEARLASSTADRIQGEATLATSRAAYLSVTGIPAEGAITLPPIPPGVPTNKDDAIKEAVMNNPDVIALQYDELASVDNVDGVWGELLPEVELTASASRSLNSSGESTQIDSAEAMINLTVPLYQSGSVYSRLRESKQQVSELKMALDAQRRSATESASRSWETLQAAQARVVSFRTAIQAATIAFEGVEREAAVGSRTVLDVLDAEQELLDSRVNYIRAERDEVVTTYELLSSMGRLTAHYLQLPVDLYDPSEHYNEVRDKWFGGDSSGDFQ